jgi:hypothetical protein
LWEGFRFDGETSADLKNTGTSDLWVVVLRAGDPGGHPRINPT